MNAAVLALGSPHLGDSAFGAAVLRELSARGMPGVRMALAPRGGLSLLDLLAGVEQAVLVDAVLDPGLPAGTLLTGQPAPGSHFGGCDHDCTLEQSLAIGNTLDMSLPDPGRIHTLAVVARRLGTFGAAMSPEVVAAVHPACDRIATLLAEAAHA